MHILGFEDNPSVVVQPNCTIGLAISSEAAPVVFEGSAAIRLGTVIYADNKFGDGFQTGHNAVIRERCQIGRHVLVGTGTVIDGQVTLGNYIKIESNCYIPTHCVFGDRVFLGPNVVITNDRLPLRQRATYQPEGCILEDDVTIGGNVVICPGVRVGKGSFIAAGSVVTKDVPAGSLVKGNPGRSTPLPEMLDEPNMALSWQKYIDPKTGKLV